MPTEGTFDVRHTTEDVVQASPPIPLPPLPEFPLTPEGVMGTLARLRRNSSVTISLNRDGTPSVQIFNLPVPLDPRSEALGIPLTHETAAISKNTSFKEENKSAIIRDNVAMSEDAGFHSKVDRFANASYRDEDFIAEGHQTNEDRYVNSNGEEKKADDEESDEEDYWAIDKQEDEFKNVGTVERIQNIIFSVLFSMAHGNNAGALLEYGSDIIEDLQLTAFLLAPEFMVAYWLPSWLVAASNADYQNMELGQYEIYFFLATASVILLVINMIFVAGGIMRGKQVSMLPIKLLRFLATVLPTVLYIPIFEILVSVLTCNQVIPRGPDDAITLQNTSCSDPMRWPLVVTSTVALLVYVPTGVSLAAV
ncbi:hypothetical protein BC830DRAFT_1172973 [Chytriomyces sp. MP71]|nr:hypothetical protein BC830DRAFT_1172973 [Chytriomyces sp. MP71]